MAVIEHTKALVLELIVLVLDALAQADAKFLVLELTVTSVAFDDMLVTTCAVLTA